MSSPTTGDLETRRLKRGRLEHGFLCVRCSVCHPELTDEEAPAGRPDNLFEPVAGDFGALLMLAIAAIWAPR